VVLVDLGYVAKVRPCVVIAIGMAAASEQTETGQRDNSLQRTA
jgi:hypothetical protein